MRASQNWSWKHFLETKQRLWSTSTHSSITHLIELAGLKQLGGPVVTSLCSEWQKKKKKVPDHRVNIFLRNSLSPVCSDLRHLSVSTDKSRSKMVTEYEQRELWYGKLLYRFKRVAVCIQNTDSTVGRILCQWMFSM